MCSSNAPSTQPAATALSSHVAACQYGSWHPRFRSHCLRSCIIPLPTAFVEYLLSDGVYLGDASQALPAAATCSSDDDDDEDTAPAMQHPASAATTAAAPQAEADEDESDSSQQDWTELFPELNARISTAIDDLGGKVVPKLNWSCPLDAVWVNPLSSLACENTEQVVLMLKSSDRVVHDLELLRDTIVTCPASNQPQQQEQQRAADAEGNSTDASCGATLVLRKWYDLRPEREWRCFVRNRRLVGICQRDPTQHFPQICNEAGCQVHDEGSNGHDQASDLTKVAAGQVAREARRVLYRFHDEHVRDTFPLRHYTYDAYVAINNTVRLIDFNPVGGTTSTLLFTWEQLGLDSVAAAADADHDQPRASTPSPASEDIHSALAEPSVGFQQVNEIATEESDDEDEAEDASHVLLRVVPAAGMVQPGHRAACSMPFDMLGLRATVEDMVQQMRQQA